MEDHRPDTGPPAQITQRPEDPNSAHGTDQPVTNQADDTGPAHTYPLEPHHPGTVATTTPASRQHYHTPPPREKRSTSETPPHHRKPLLPLQLISLIPALLGIALLSGVLSGLPSGYRRTWHFLCVDRRYLTQNERSEWVKPFRGFLRLILFTASSSPLHYLHLLTLLQTVALLAASFLWTFLAILARFTTRARRGFHPGVQIAASLLLSGALAYASAQGLRWTLVDFDPGDKMRAHFWLSNVRGVYYTGERGHGAPGHPLPGELGEHDAPGVWYWTGDPDPASNKHRYWLACAGFGLGLIMAYAVLVLSPS